MTTTIGAVAARLVQLDTDADVDADAAAGRSA
jgi:hypothetical protein